MPKFADILLKSNCIFTAAGELPFAGYVAVADGKILAALNDATQPKIAIDTNGAIVEASYKDTKRMLGSEYGMEGKVDNDGNGVMKEWDAQSAAFSAFCAGKTAAEVAGLQTQEAGGHLIAVDTALLEAGCSMQITDFMAAVAKACSDKHAVTFEAGEGFKLGVAAKSTAAESKAASAEGNGSANLYSDFGAAVVGTDGKILAALNDATQPKISVSTAGAITNADYKGTKRELGDAYGMVAYGGAAKEWFEQAAAFDAACIGKTAAEIASLMADNNYGVADLQSAGCTILVTGLVKAASKIG